MQDILEQKRQLIEDFFELIYGELEGFACVTRKGIDGNLTTDKFFQWPEQKEGLVNYCTRWHHEDVYFTGHLTDGKGRRKANMVAGRVAFGDADECKPTSLLAEPTVVVHTSEDKSHVYWLVEDTTDPIELERMSHAVSVAHPKDTTGYDTGWATNKLLRVPGTYNNKYSDTVPYELHYEVSGVTWTQESFAEHYKLPEKVEAVSLDMADIPSKEEAMESLNWSVQLQEILQGTYFANQGYSRYKVLHLAIHELFRSGATNEQVFAILENHTLNKWAEDGVSKAGERLWDDIVRARVQAELSNSDLIGEFDEDLLPELPETNFDFLTEEERANLKPTFIDKFASWSASKTKTARVYQEAAAFGLLSTVLSELAHIPMNFGPERLNLWFIVGGRSTIDRKSTVKRHMLSVLGALSDDEDYLYNLGSDFTVQGLSDVLLDRPNRSGIVYIDEFQGFLEETTKNYMSGTKSTLTDMYDGTIRGKIRSTAVKKQRNEVQYSLNIYALGIAKQIAGQLTEDDFYSGFLNRFLWIMPPSDYTPPSITEGFDLAPQEKRKEDTEFHELVQMLRQSRTYFEQFTDGLDAQTEPMIITAEAHERMSQLLSDMEKAAKRIGKEQVMQAGQRLVHSTYKAAALLAMVDCREQVELNDVLTAISYSNSWFSNLITMSNSISSTEWNRQLEEIHELLDKRGGEMQYGALYREFKALYKPKDFKDMLTALEESGYIRLKSEAGRSIVTSISR